MAHRGQYGAVLLVLLLTSVGSVAAATPTAGDTTAASTDTVRAGARRAARPRKASAKSTVAAADTAQTRAAVTTAASTDTARSGAKRAARPRRASARRTTAAADTARMRATATMGASADTAHAGTKRAAHRRRASARRTAAAADTAGTRATTASRPLPSRARAFADTLHTPGAEEAARRAAAAPNRGELGPDPEAIWADLMEGNKRFAAGTLQVHELVNHRQELATAQHPQAIVLGCSDSRVPPELVFDKSAGDLFVVRTAGNVADRVALGSLEYAVEHLHVHLLVVLGHERCGAVTAAALGDTTASPNLRAVLQQIEPALARLRPHASGDRLVSMGIEANVYQSAQDLLKNSAILRHAQETGELTIVKALYQLSTGTVARLQ